MLPLLLIAVSVGMSNLAAAVSIGLGGVTPRTRWRVGLIFGLFEAGMPIIGLVIGAGLATGIGQLARWIGSGLLIVIGCGTVLRAWKQSAGDNPGPHLAGSLGGLIITAFALSLDNLAAGFALGTLNVSIAEGAIVIGVVSVGLSLIGLQVGQWFGEPGGRRGEQIGGAILVAVGVAIAAGAL